MFDYTIKVQPKAALTTFLNSIKNEKTFKTYNLVLNDFIKDIYILKGITRYTIAYYKSKFNNYSDSSIATKMAAIRSFLFYCWEQGWITSNPGLLVGQNIVTKYQHSKNIEIKDFKKLIFNKRNLPHTRDNLILLCLYFYGSPEKVLNLKWSDSLCKPLIKFKKQYLNQLKKDYTKTEIEVLQTGYLFFDTRKRDSSKPLSKRYITFILEDRNKQVGFKTNHIDLMTIKRLGAKELYNRTNSVEQVMKYCGHKHRRTTYTFIQNLS